LDEGTKEEMMTTEVPTLSPHHTMMLVMDYQPAALHHRRDVDGLLSRMARAIDMARRSGMPIGYVRMASMMPITLQ